MFETLFAHTPTAPDAVRLGLAPRPLRPQEAPSLAPWLSLALDQVDYGMLLLDNAGQMLHANRAARSDLDHSHPLQLLGRELRARLSRDVAPLHEALSAAATRGLQRLLTVGEEDARVGVSVVPLGRPEPGVAQPTLVLLGRRKACEALSLQWFARSHGLTPAETRVLEALCRGTAPTLIASNHGVGIATVRSQIGAIRFKTGSASIRSLVDTVMRLPPMVGTVRQGPTLATMAPWPTRAHPAQQPAN